MIARLLAAASIAFLLPGPVLLRQYAQRRSEAVPSRIELTGTLSLWGAEARAFAGKNALPLSQPLSGETQDRLDLPARLTLEAGRCELALGESGRSLGTLTNDRGQVGGDPAGSALAGAVALVRDGCAALLWRGTEAVAGLEGLLRAHGGDPEAVSLTRFDGRVAYAIGGAKAALVLSQDGLLPLRLLLRENGTAADVRFGEYAPVCFDGGFPAQIAVLQDGAPLATFRATLPVK
ncbi:MAG: hypothetical protein ACYDCL_01255 [Myxococcales bacterium]